MGGAHSGAAFREAVLDLVNNPQAVTTQDDTFWERYWRPTLSPYDYFTLVSAQDVKDLRERASGNLTALCFKVVERISAATATACSGQNDHSEVLNCVRLLTRLFPFLFEAPDWRLLFWSPANFAETQNGEQPQALAQVLLNALADLLFCPDFTVTPRVRSGPEIPDDLSSLDSCEFIWEKGIGCVASPGSTKAMDSNRMEILKLLLTCFSEPLYSPPSELHAPNRWLAHFTSPENRHILPLLTSLINVVCTYDPVGYGVPYYYAMVRDPRGELVETASQVLSLVLDYSLPLDLARRTSPSVPSVGGAPPTPITLEPGLGNLFCGYVSRLHQVEDLELIAKGLTTLLCNPLKHTYLPHSIKKIYFTQELYILAWKLFELNKKFLIHMLRSPALFDLIVPLLHQLLETRTNPALVGLLHVGVFILLVLSGERNFGVRLNKPYVPRAPTPDLPKFSGTHADLLFLVFHKIITSGLPRLQPLYDCLLTVLVNVSPYLKTLSMVTCARLMHLMESFSTPWFLFAKPTNHYLVFYLLEIFNNIIQYQFDGNTNMVYSIIRCKSVFYQLASLSEDSCLHASVQHPHLPVAMAALEQGEPGDRVPSSSSPSPEHPARTVQTVADVEPSPSPLPPPQEHGQGVEQSDLTSVVPPRESQSPIPVPDIEPPKGVSTVEVEVKPGMGSEPTTPSDPTPPREIEREVTPPPKPKPLLPEDAADTARTPSPQDEGTAARSPPHTQTPDPGPEPVTVPEPHPLSQPHPLGQSHTPALGQPRPLSVRPSGSGLDASHLGTGAPPPPPGFMEGAKAEKSRRGKGAGLSVANLLPLHKHVGQQTKQLAEPSTPDFKPTPDWVRAWKHRLPLNTILRVLQVLVPQVEKLCADNNVKTEHEILDYLKNGTLVGLLPVPHPILIRKYQTSESTEVWFHTYIWGVVYVRNFDPPIWYDTEIRLFQVNKQTM